MLVFFFFLLKHWKTTTFALVVIIFLFLLFCISQIFFSKYVFSCNQENVIILLIFLNIIILSGLRNNSPGKSIIYRPSVFIPKILSWTCVWKIPGISLSETEVRDDWLIHLHSLWIPTMCWVPCRGQIPQKTLSLPEDTSYDAVLRGWQQAEYTVQPNYGMLSSYWKRMSYIHTWRDYRFYC